MTKLWIKNYAFRRMIKEANYKAPLETGGLLVGYFSRDNSEVVVTQVVGPGPKAIHGRSFFCPDEGYHEDKMAEIYDENDGKIFYLGDWHTHPHGPGSMSRKDKTALKNISRFPENYVDNPVMVVLYGDVREWRPRAWRIFGTPYYPLCSYSGLLVCMYDSKS